MRFQLTLNRFRWQGGWISRALSHRSKSCWNRVLCFVRLRCKTMTAAHSTVDGKWMARTRRGNARQCTVKSKFSRALSRQCRSKGTKCRKTKTAMIQHLFESQKPPRSRRSVGSRSEKSRSHQCESDSMEAGAEKFHSANTTGSEMSRNQKSEAREPTLIAG